MNTSADDAAQAGPVSRWTRQEKAAWCKERARQEPWHTAIGSMVQDMELMGIPLDPAVIQAGMGEAVIGGEPAVWHWVDGIR